MLLHVWKADDQSGVLETDLMKMIRTDIHRLREPTSLSNASRLQPCLIDQVTVQLGGLVHASKVSNMSVGLMASEGSNYGY